jgi:hypothetical protein
LPSGREGKKKEVMEGGACGAVEERSSIYSQLGTRKK